MVDISIIIVNYKVKDYIIPCIDSIYQTINDQISFEIIVVDNHSNDGSVEAIQDLFPKVIQLHNNQNKGFSKGVNQGASQANGEFIFILNPDTIIGEKCVESLIKIIQNDSKIGAIGPRMVSEHGHTQLSYWRFPTLLNTLTSLFHLDRWNNHKNYGSQSTDKHVAVDSISGGAILICKSVFNDLMGFDNNLFWMEDIDFCYRAKNNGYHIIYHPETKVIHHQGKSAEKNLQLAIANQLISKIKYFKKHGTHFDQFVLSTGILTVSIIKMIIFFWLSPYKSIYKLKLLGNWKAIKWILSRQSDGPLLT